MEQVSMFSKGGKINVKNHFPHKFFTIIIPLIAWIGCSGNINNQESRAIITVLISADLNGQPLQNTEWVPESSISSNGRFVAFESEGNMAPNIPPGNNLLDYEIYVRDTWTKTNVCASVDPNGKKAYTSGASGFKANPSISEDGRYVTFESAHSSIVLHP